MKSKSRRIDYAKKKLWHKLETRDGQEGQSVVYLSIHPLFITAYSVQGRRGGWSLISLHSCCFFFCKITGATFLYEIATQKYLFRELRELNT